jgi:hypothetical protein
MRVQLLSSSRASWAQDWGLADAISIWRCSAIVTFTSTCHLNIFRKSNSSHLIPRYNHPFRISRVRSCPAFLHNGVPNRTIRRPPREQRVHIRCLYVAPSQHVPIQNQQSLTLLFSLPRFLVSLLSSLPASPRIPPPRHHRRRRRRLHGDLPNGR